MIVKELGHGVGVATVLEPGAVLEHADPGSGEETHLGGELAGLFAAEGEFFGEFKIEEDDGVAHVGAVLGAAEAEDINTGLPGDLFGRDIEMGDGIGEARAIHVEFEPERFAAKADGVEFGRGVNGADFGGLGDGDGAGFGEVEVSAAADHMLNAFGIDLAGGGLEEENFGAVGEEFGCAAFVGFHMGDFGAKDGMVGLAERGEGEGVGGGAVKNEEDFALGLEDFADEVGRAGGVGIVAVGAGVAVIGFLEGGPCFGADAGVVIAGELAAVGVVLHGKRMGKMGAWGEEKGFLPDWGLWRVADRLVGREEVGGFEEPSVVAEEDAGVGMVVGDEADGDAFPEMLDAFAVVGIAFPDECVRQEDAGKEIAGALAAFEEGFEFETVEGQADEVIETDALADKNPEVGFGEVVEGDFAEVEPGREGGEVPKRVAEFFAFELEEGFVGVEVAGLGRGLRG